MATMKYISNSICPKVLPKIVRGITVNYLYD